MAVNADPGSALFSSPVLQLLAQAIGGTTDQNITKNENKTGTQTGNQTVTGNQNVTGAQTQQTNQTQTGTTTGKTTGTQQQTSTQQQSGATTGKTQNVADVGNLQAILAQQMGGITPQALQAIFQEGAKAAPQLITGTANAVGARAVNNDPMATALTNLSAQLTNQAALLDMQQKNQAAGTAEAIARLTSGQETSGTQTGNVTGSSNTNSTQDVLQNVLNTILGNTETNTNQNTTTNQNTATNTTNTENSNSTTNNQTDTSLDTGNISKLLGGLLLGGMVNSGVPGGIGGLVGGAMQGGGDLIRQLIGSLTGAAVPGVYEDGMGMGQIGAAPQDLRDLLTKIERGYATNELAGSDADFWSAIGIDPASLSPWTPGEDWWQTELAPTEDTSDPSYWDWP